MSALNLLPGQPQGPRLAACSPRPLTQPPVCARRPYWLRRCWVSCAGAAATPPSRDPQSGAAGGRLQRQRQQRLARPPSEDEDRPPYQASCRGRT